MIAQIATGPEGDIYLLDQQLTEVKVFSRAGDYLRTIGREGEGPGEFRRPGDMFLLPDGNVGVLQWAVHEFESGMWHSHQRTMPFAGDFWQRISRWARVLLPE